MLSQSQPQPQATFAGDDSRVVSKRQSVLTFGNPYTSASREQGEEDSEESRVLSFGGGAEEEMDSKSTSFFNILHIV